jgi:glutathione S-transferase
MTPAGEPFAEAIDGQDGKTWHLPLAPLSATSTPEAYSPGEDPPRDRLEAAAKLLGNHAAIVRFALRGAGRPGKRPVSAPLADPTAEPAMEFEPAVDAAMRHVVHALLVGVEAKQVTEQALQVTEGVGGCWVCSVCSTALHWGVRLDRHVGN